MTQTTPPAPAAQPAAEARFKLSTAQGQLLHLLNGDAELCESAATMTWSVGVPGGFHVPVRRNTAHKLIRFELIALRDAVGAHNNWYGITEQGRAWCAAHPPLGAP